MDSALRVTFESDPIYSEIGEVSNLTVNDTSISSIYADDTSVSLGNLSFDTGYFSDALSLQGEALALVSGNYIVVPDFRASSVVPGPSNLTISGNFNGLSGYSGSTNNMNFEYNFAYCEVVLSGPSIIFRDTQGSQILRIPAPSGFTSTYPVGTKFGLNPGNGLNVVSSFAQSVGLVFLPNIFLNWPTEPSILPDFESMIASISDGTPARFVEVVQYVGGYESDVEIYPVAEEEPTIISVEANETQVIDLTLNSWVVSVNQPTCIDFVQADENYYDGTDGVYAVAGNDNRPIKASQWNAFGGNLSVAKHPTDPKIIQVTVRGMSDGTYGPFRIAMTSGNFYSALRVTGDAVIGKPVTHRFPTGVDESLTKTEVAVTVDYPCVQTLEQVYLVGGRAAQQYTGLVSSLEGAGGNGVKVLDLIERDDRRYVIRSTSGDQTPIKDFSGEPLDRMEFFEEVWDNGVDTMADFEAQWAGKSMKDFMIAYLRRDA